MAVEFSAGEGGGALCDAVVEEGVERGRHFGGGWLVVWFCARWFDV